MHEYLMPTATAYTEAVMEPLDEETPNTGDARAVINRSTAG